MNYSNSSSQWGGPRASASKSHAPFNLTEVDNLNRQPAASHHCVLGAQVLPLGNLPVVGRWQVCVHAVLCGEPREVHYVEGRSYSWLRGIRELMSPEYVRTHHPGLPGASLPVDDTNAPTEGTQAPKPEPEGGPLKPVREACFLVAKDYS